MVDYVTRDVQNNNCTCTVCTSRGPPACMASGLDGRYKLSIDAMAGAE